MNHLFRILLSVVSILALAYGALSLLASYRFSSALALSPQKSRTHMTSREQYELAQELKRAANSWFASGEARLAYAKQLIRVARSGDGKEKSQISWCDACSEIQLLLDRNGEKAELLMLLARAEFEATKQPCSSPIKIGDAWQSTQQALSRAPYDPDIIFAAALLADQLGREGDNFQLLNRFLKSEPELRGKQQEYILSKLQGGAAFEAIVPARFPQLTEWMALYRSRSAEWFSISKASLGRTLRSAFERARGQALDGELQESIYHSYLLSIEKIDFEHPVRKSVDQEISRILARQGNQSLSDYFLARSGLEQLRFIAGQRLSDSRPERKPLYDWGSRAAIYLDNAEQSVGFYLAPRQLVSLIEIRVPQKERRLDPSVIRLLVSDDNIQWRDLSTDLSRGVFSMEGINIIHLQLPPQSFRYWKLHFDIQSRTKQIGGELRSLLRVYGRSAIKADNGL